jgi:hypothetical protein
MEVWVGLSSWIVQDGNYSDFQVGDIVRFALEFKPIGEVSRVSASHKELSHMAGAEYVAVGERVSKDLPPIFDFGVMAYTKPGVDDLLDDARTGDFIASRIYLGVDPFFYKEDERGEPGITPLIYAWEIEKILIQTSPFIESVDRNGRKQFIRDPALLGYRELSATDALSDDNGRASYVLVCRKLDGPPETPDEAFPVT